MMRYEDLAPIRAAELQAEAAAWRTAEQLAAMRRAERRYRRAERRCRRAERRYRRAMLHTSYAS